MGTRTAIFTIASTLLFTGCASLKAEFDGLEYPPDTAILIGHAAYQINTVKCAEIKAVGKDGSLDCYDSDGRAWAPVTPVADWRRKYVTERLGVAWASPEHQAWLFYMFHGGGTEKAVRQFMSATQQAAGNIETTKNLVNSIDRSRDIAKKAPEIKRQGMAAYLIGGMPAWQAHQSKVIQWHLDNSRHFASQMSSGGQLGP